VCPAVFVGDLHDQPEVGFDQLAGRLGIAVLDEACRERALFVGREQRIAPGLAHVDGHRIALRDRSAARRWLRHLGAIVCDFGTFGSVFDIDRARGEIDVRALELDLVVLGVGVLRRVVVLGPLGVVVGLLLARLFPDVDDL